MLSCVGCVTRLITSRCQGCSDYLLDFPSTIMHFTIIPLVLCVLLSWLTSSVVVALSPWAYVGVLQTRYQTPFTKVRSHVIGNPLLQKRLITSVVTQPTFHLWGNTFVITLRWKFLLQTRYNIIYCLWHTTGWNLWKKYYDKTDTSCTTYQYYFRCIKWEFFLKHATNWTSKVGKRYIQELYTWEILALFLWAFWWNLKSNT
jgi:hypothetical protein